MGSISVKAHIVTNDERETTGLRNLVNFGHTIGHAIEAVLTPSILHGECISVGMILEAEVARQLGHLSQVGVGRLTRCLKSYGLPVSLSDPRITDLPVSKLLTVDRLLDIMKIDKKNSGSEKKIVLLATIGKTVEQRASVVPDPVIEKTLAEAAKVIPGVPTKSPIRMATPGSKSISNRALVLAALGSGTCRLRNMLHSDDTQVMMSALHELKVYSGPPIVRTLSLPYDAIGCEFRVGRWRRDSRCPRRTRVSPCAIQRQGDILGQRRNGCSVPDNRLYARPALQGWTFGHRHHWQCKDEATSDWSPC